MYVHPGFHSRFPETQQGRSNTNPIPQMRERRLRRGSGLPGVTQQVRSSGGMSGGWRGTARGFLPPRCVASLLPPRLLCGLPMQRMNQGFGAFWREVNLASSPFPQTTCHRPVALLPAAFLLETAVSPHALCPKPTQISIVFLGNMLKACYHCL